MCVEDLPDAQVSGAQAAYRAWLSSCSADSLPLLRPLSGAEGVGSCEGGPGGVDPLMKIGHGGVLLFTLPSLSYSFPVGSRNVLKAKVYLLSKMEMMMSTWEGHSVYEIPDTGPGT